MNTNQLMSFLNGNDMNALGLGNMLPSRVLFTIKKDPYIINNIRILSWIPKKKR